MARESLGERRIELDGPSGRGAIVFDPARVEQAQPEWFDAAWWGEAATPVATGGRGAAWFVEAPFGRMVLRGYRRGGAVANISRDRYLWSGESRARSIAEFRLLQDVARRGVRVPGPIAAVYRREGISYGAAILLERIDGARTLAESVGRGDADWEAAGRLVAQAHRACLDHADLNADNILFDALGEAWLIDLDRGRLRTPGAGWRERNIERLHRSLLKRRDTRSIDEIEAGFARLRAAYEQEMNA